MTGNDLRHFIDKKLFPYLKKFKSKAKAPNTIEYKIGEIFSGLKNKIQNGHNLRKMIDQIDTLHFQTQEEKIKMSRLYEGKLQAMEKAGRDGGEHYTPRALVRAIVNVIGPSIGNKIYDGAMGSAGFLCTAFEHLKESEKMTKKHMDILQNNTFYGKEKTAFAYTIGIMNMIFHGIGSPNIAHANTLTENPLGTEQKDHFDIVLTNPPFGGKERKEAQQAFPIQTGDVASLFLQHFVNVLKTGGRAGVVIKNTFLSDADNDSIRLRKTLLENCNLYTILDLPRGVFAGTKVKAIVLFFEKGAPTKNIWYYQLDPGRILGNTDPLNEKDLKEFTELQKDLSESKRSWTINIKDINQDTYDLSAKNPHDHQEEDIKHPQEILAQIKVLDRDTADILTSLERLL